MYDDIEAEKKWLTFGLRRFQMHLCNVKFTIWINISLMYVTVSPFDNS